MDKPYQPPKCRGDRHASWCGVYRVWVVSLWNHCRTAQHLRLYEPVAARIRDLYGASNERFVVGEAYVTAAEGGEAPAPGTH